MPKRELAKEYLEWIDSLDAADDVKAKVRDHFLSQPVAEKVGNLHSGMTQAQQRAAELAKQAERAAAWDKFGEENKAILQHWQTLAPHLSRYSPQDIVARLNDQQQQSRPTVQRQRDEAYEAIRAKLDSGELEWDDAKVAIRAIDRRLEQLYGSADQIDSVRNEWSKFKDQEVPTFIGGFQKSLEDLKEQQRQIVRAVAGYVNDALEYKNQHPKRDIRKIYDAYASGKHQSYEDAAKEVYGEQDLESEINERAEVKFQDFLKTRPKTNDPGEGSMAGGSMAVFQRPHRRQPEQPQQPTTPTAPVFPKSEAAARNMIFDLLNEPPRSAAQ